MTIGQTVLGGRLHQLATERGRAVPSSPSISRRLAAGGCAGLVCQPSALLPAPPAAAAWQPRVRPGLKLGPQVATLTAM